MRLRGRQLILRLTPKDKVACKQHVLRGMLSTVFLSQRNTSILRRTLGRGTRNSGQVYFSSPHFQSHVPKGDFSFVQWPTKILLVPQSYKIADCDSERKYLQLFIALQLRSWPA